MKVLSIILLWLGIACLISGVAFAGLVLWFHATAHIEYWGTVTNGLLTGAALIICSRLLKPDKEK